MLSTLSALPQHDDLEIFLWISGARVRVHFVRGCVTKFGPLERHLSYCSYDVNALTRLA